ncbi:hypothetical protein SUGI_0120560, partial [Cryptomeria japonica]
MVVCIWLDCCTGASYGFSIYSQTIKTRFGYTQQQLDTISVFAGLGGIGGILAGLLYQCFPPWIVLLLGALHNLIGYAALWLFLTGRLTSPALWELCLATCIAMNSELYYSTASMVTCVTNFPANRGIVVGLKKGCLGLSSAILSTLWQVFFQRADGSSFLLVGGIVPSAVALLIMPIVRKYDPGDCENGSSSTMKNLAMVSAPLVFLALFLMGSAFWDGHTLQANRVEFAITLVILATPLYVAWKASNEERTSTKNSKILVPLMSQGDSNIFDRYVIA